jgi:hypothetical protein
VVEEPLVEEPVVGEPPVKEQSTGQSPNSGPLPLLVSQLMQISPTQLLSLTGTELAGLGLNIIGLPSESLTNLSAAQVAALTNVQISALSLRMISLPYVESSIGNSSFWPEPLNLQEIRTLDPNPIVSIQSLGVPTVNAPLYSLTAQSIFNRLNLETPTSVIEVVPQIIDKILMPGNLLYQLVKTGSENAGLDEFLHHHLAPEALGLVSFRQISGRTDLVSSVCDLFSQAVNGQVSLTSIVEDNISASCRIVLLASDQPSSARVFEGVVLMNLNSSGQIEQLSFIDDHPGDSALPTRAT